MHSETMLIGVCLSDEHALDLEMFAQACGTAADEIREFIDAGLLRPAVEQPVWRFGGEELARVRRIRRLQRDFEANLDSVAVMLDLTDEIKRLRAALRRAGIEA
ncbi:MerR family transcriptional regulator [Ideonella azotifigens]|uniref:Chaperone modulator CbpM n=1 Tax=Ideonella azotifigens TaxID=513160 RepID=A0ABN1JWM7_9BURK|nr:chaperone modulator CbpM [Ideonella azotifigens]MCD2341193.1 MerR family transcriptional regulator [Ideonella azotifigens]